MINKRWLDKLPKDLQEILLSVIAEESKSTRALTVQQYDTEVAKAKEAGVEFSTLSEQDINQLKKEAEPVLHEWGNKIGPEYLAKVRADLGN